MAEGYTKLCTFPLSFHLFSIPTTNFFHAATYNGEAMVIVLWNGDGPKEDPSGSFCTQKKRYLK